MELPTALKVGRRKAAAMLIFCLEFRYQMKKSAKNVRKNAQPISKQLARIRIAPVQD
jgi:hypothetical protein